MFGGGFCCDVVVVRRDRRRVARVRRLGRIARICCCVYEMMGVVEISDCGDGVMVYGVY